MKVLVSGAGIAGLASALFLARKGWSVTVVEKAPALRTEGYMIDFFGPGYDAAEASGLLPKLVAQHHDFDAVAYVNEAGKTRSILDYRLFRASVKNRLLALLRGEIERTLYAAVPEDVSFRFGTRIEAIENGKDGVSAKLSDGMRLDADLLVGADGIHSDVRALVFGPEERFLRRLGYHTAAFVFTDAELSRRMRGRFEILSVPNRQVGLYPIGADRLASFFAHTSDADLPADAEARLKEVYGDLGWHVPRLLKAANQGPDIYYDLVAQIEMPRWHEGRTVLVGDACYAVSLLAGQGASLAIAGPHLLARHLEHGSIGEALDSYEADLKPLIAEKQAGGRRTADWFVPPTRLHNFARDQFLNMTRLPGLSNLLRWFFAPSLKGIGNK